MCIPMMLRDLFILACSGIMAVQPACSISWSWAAGHWVLVHSIADLYGHGAMSIDCVQQRADVRNRLPGMHKTFVFGQD